MKRPGSIAAATLALSMLAAFVWEHPASAAKVHTGACTTSKSRFKTSKTIEETAALSFETIPGTTIEFRQSGNKAKCVRVEFSVVAYVRNSAKMEVRARLDGNAVAKPGIVQLSGDDDENNADGAARARAFLFVFPKVKPGKHTVRIEWRSTVQTFINIERRTTVVHHR